MSNYYRKSQYSSRRNSYKNYIISPYWQSYDFIKQRFFSFNNDTFLKFANYYCNKYGEGPKKYLIKTYPKWKLNIVSLSNKSGIRLLQCVPKFLSINDKFEILKFYLPVIAEKLNNSIKWESIKFSEIDKLYFYLSKECLKFSCELDWFAESVFNNDEIEELLDVLKFAMMNRIKKSYYDVKSDTEFFYKILKRINYDYVIVFTYQIDFLNCSIDIDGINALNKRIIFPSFQRPILVTKYGEGFNKILLNHTLKINLETDKTKYNYYFIRNDIKKLLIYLSNLEKKQEFDCNIKVDGKRGYAKLYLYKKNLLRLHSKIWVATIKFILSIAVTGVTFWILIKTEHYRILLFLTVVAIGVLCSFGNKILQIRSEVKDYEIGRKIRFTKN
jgi:hypothetical protein